MKKFLAISVLSAAMLFGGGISATAETATTSADTALLQTQIQQLLAQITELKAQIAELKSHNTSLTGDVSQLKQALQIRSHLHKGMSGEDVKHLQEVLATDPDIFSDANVTGFFGPMTEHAVKRFQKHFGFDVVGEVGPKTLKKINELLKEKDVDEQDLSDGTDGDLGDLGDANDDVDNEEMEHGQNASSTVERDRDHEGRNGSATSSQKRHDN